MTCWSIATTSAVIVRRHTAASETPVATRPKRTKRRQGGARSLSGHPGSDPLHRSLPFSIPAIRRCRCLQDLPDALHEFPGLERLVEMIRPARTVHRAENPLPAETRYGEDVEGDPAFPQDLDHLHPGHRRHPQVGHHQIERILPPERVEGRIDRPDRALLGMDIVPGLPKGEAGGEQEILLVVHDQDPFGCFHGGLLRLLSFATFPQVVCQQETSKYRSTNSAGYLGKSAGGAEGTGETPGGAPPRGWNIYPCRIKGLPECAHGCGGRNVAPVRKTPGGAACPADPVFFATVPLTSACGKRWRSPSCRPIRSPP